MFTESICCWVAPVPQKSETLDFIAFNRYFQLYAGAHSLEASALFYRSDQFDTAFRVYSKFNILCDPKPKSHMYCKSDEVTWIYSSIN
jgi:hypothetical protein